MQLPPCKQAESDSGVYARKTSVIRRFWPSSFLFVLSACTSLPHETRSLIGMSRPAIVSCAGIPDREEYRDGQDVLVWKQDTPTMNGINLKALLSFELDLSSRGTCQPVATLREGRVVSIAFTGPSATIEGPDGACRPILREVSEARFEEVKRINTLQNFPYSEACQ